MFDTHLLGAFHVLRPAWKVMRERGYGRIVNISSGSVFGVYFFRGHRNGVLDAPVRFGAGTTMCVMLKVGDFNRDGKPDVLQLGYDNNTYVYLNRRP